MHTFCVLRRNGWWKGLLKKLVSLHIITLKVVLYTLTLSTQGYNKQIHVKKSHFIVSIFLHT